MLNFFNRIKKNKKGFTLTELIIVVAILAILAAIATPMITGYVSESKEKADKMTAKAVEESIKRAMARDILDLSAEETDFNDVKDAIKGEFPTVPTPQQGGTFRVKVSDGKVDIGTATSGYIVLAAPASGTPEPTTGP